MWPPFFFRAIPTYGVLPYAMIWTNVFRLTSDPLNIDLEFPSSQWDEMDRKEWDRAYRMIWFDSTLLIPSCGTVGWDGYSIAKRNHWQSILHIYTVHKFLIQCKNKVVILAKYLVATMQIL